MNRKTIESYDNPETINAVRLELAIRKHIDRNKYVKAKYLADVTDYNSMQVSRALEILEHEGEIEKWSESSRRGTTYEILL